MKGLYFLGLIKLVDWCDIIQILFKNVAVPYTCLTIVLPHVKH